MGLAVVTVAAGGLPVVEAAIGTPVTEAANGRGMPVTKVAARGLPVVFETIGVAVPPTYAGFDGTPLTVTLSNGNLTATRTNTSIVAAGARNTFVKNTGKRYFEVTVGATNGAQDCVAIGLATHTYAQILAGQGAIVAFTSNGPVWINGADTGKSIGSNIVAGNVVCCAVDLDAHYIWFRKNNGLWFNDVSANPATGVNPAFGIPAGAYAPMVAFGGTGSAINNNMTANFGATAFAYAVPAGFTSGWPA